MNKLVYIAIAVRVLTNMQPFSDALYFIGRDLFEIVALYLLSKQTNNELTRRILLFCCSLCVYNIVKPLLIDVTKIDYFEYIGFIIGIVYVFKTNNSRYRSGHTL